MTDEQGRFMFNAVEGVISAVRDINCDCSLRERESGHHVDCWKPYVDEQLMKARKSLDKAKP